MYNPAAMMQMMQAMLSKNGGNTQMLIQNIIRQNPKFAQMIQGQNPEILAKNALSQMGINPQDVIRMMNGFIGKH